MRSPRWNCHNRNLRLPDRYRIVWSELGTESVEKRRTFDDRNRHWFRVGRTLRQHPKVAALGARNGGFHPWGGGNAEAQAIADSGTLNNRS
jgi:hypothetical protein